MTVITRFAGAALGLGVALASAGAALAETHDIDGITVTVSGRVDPTTALDVSQPTPASVFGSPYIAINLGQPGGANPYAPNPGWDPYGLSDTTHHWINIGDNSTGGIYNLTGGLLSIIWGSPNDSVPTSSNAVTFYSGLNGGGSVLGTVLSSDLYDNFAGINNTQDPKPHLGDLANLTVKQNGTGTATFMLSGVTLGDGANSLFHDGGTAIVIHAKADDLMSDPSGNSGDRVACGVIAK